jgi:hypothetical protein
MHPSGIAAGESGVTMVGTPDPASIDRQTLSGPVRSALGRSAATIIDWHSSPLADGGDPKTAGLLRVAGRADDHGESISWSLVLKVLRPTGENSDPTHPNYWKREVLAYQSGLLTALPSGVTAPRYFGVTEYNDGVWLWLEDIRDGWVPRWTLDSYGKAAYILGRFNAVCAKDSTRFDAPWWSHGWLDGWLGQFSAGLGESLGRVLNHPLVRQVCFGENADRLLQLFADRVTFAAALEGLPQGFCHHDAWRRNLVLCSDSAGHDRVMLIDWADAGSGALGQELAAFVWAPTIYFDVEMDGLHELEAVAWSRYLDGLRDGGWHGELSVVRLAYTADVALRSLVTAWLCETFLPDERLHQRLVTALGRPIEEIIQAQARLLPFLLDRADEARRLMRTV